MPAVPAFYSVNEPAQPPAMREYHSNSECPTARNMPPNERRNGMSPTSGRGYQVCRDCSSLNALGR
jgi:hypothetical protein